VLFHAAAGGVGLIACQWAKALGLQLIGTAGSTRSALAKSNGAAHVINYSKEDFAAAGEGDHRRQGREGGVRLGRQGHLGQVARLPAPFGLMASFGNASGPVPPFAPGMLGSKGSLYVTRQTLFTHIATREATQQMADDLFAVVTSGKVQIRIDQRYPLARCSRRTATWKRARPPAAHPHALRDPAQVRAPGRRRRVRQGHRNRRPDRLLSAPPPGAVQPATAH
jgi:NADPH2:quinone reductase